MRSAGATRDPTRNPMSVTPVVPVELRLSGQRIAGGEKPTPVTTGDTIDAALRDYRRTYSRRCHLSVSARRPVMANRSDSRGPSTGLTTPMAPVLVGGVQRDAGDAVLGADQDVGALVEVDHPTHGARAVFVGDAEGAPDVGAVDNNFTQPRPLVARLSAWPRLGRAAT
jgi:hypothetical protein